MSTIPNAKMKHAHAQEEETGTPHEAAAPTSSGADEETGRPVAPIQANGRATHIASDALGAVKSRPKTVAAIGAALVAGAAAIVGGPAAARALRSKPTKKSPAKKKTAKKG